MSSNPMPVPNTPNKSETDATSPMMSPPMIVIGGMYRLSTCSSDSPDRLKPGTCTSAFMRFFATALDESPPISTQILAKSTAKVVRNATKTAARTGSAAVAARPCGAVR